MYDQQWSLHETTKERFSINPPSDLFDEITPLLFEQSKKNAETKKKTKKIPLKTKQTLKKEPIVVAVIDSGISSEHQDLKNNMWKDPSITRRSVRGFNATVSPSPPPNPLLFDITRDKNGHGTHCAGIIGAVASNQKGIAGIAGMPGIVKLMACKSYQNSGVTVSKNTIACINYALQHGAKILNCSFEHKFIIDEKITNSKELEEAKSKKEKLISELKEAFKNAAEKGVISVIAAGNDGIEIDNDKTPCYPACFATDDDPVKNMLVVAATGQDGKLASWLIENQQGDVGKKSSNYGQKTVHLAAPGKDILSTGHSSSSSYVKMTGSSMAAPHVVGALALMMAKKPFIPSSENLSDKEKNNELQDYSEELINRLCEAAKKDDEPLDAGYKIQDHVKCGRLNLSEALQSDSEEEPDSADD